MYIFSQHTTGRNNPKTSFAASQSGGVLQKMLLRSCVALVDFAKMETDEDVQDYLDMKEMESQGLDPTDARDYIKFTREKQKKLDAEKEAREVSNAKYQKELLEFKTKYTDVDIVNLVETDSAWSSLIIPQIQSGKTLTQAYETVNNLINKSVNEKVETLAEQKAKKQMQNSLASVGSQTVGEEGENKPIDIWSMSNEEFREYQKKMGL